MQNNFTRLQEVATVLKNLTERGDALPINDELATPFHSSVVPDVAIDWYTAMIAINSGLQDE